MLRTIWFWLLVNNISNVFILRKLAQQLSNVWALISLCLFLLVFYGFDLLTCLLFLIYSSVFIYLTLLSIHLTTYWSLSYYQNAQTLQQNNIFIYFIIISISYLTINHFTYVRQIYDLGGFLTINYNLQPINMLLYLHIYFYVIFITETILLNMYLLFGLVLATAISYFKLLNHVTTYQNIKHTAQHANQAEGLKIKLVHQFRRQTRRKNSSLIKY